MESGLFHYDLFHRFALTDNVQTGGEGIEGVAHLHTAEVVDMAVRVLIKVGYDVVDAGMIILLDVSEVFPGILKAA